MLYHWISTNILNPFIDDLPQNSMSFCLIETETQIKSDLSDLENVSLSNVILQLHLNRDLTYFDLCCNLPSFEVAVAMMAQGLLQREIALVDLTEGEHTKELINEAQSRQHSQKTRK